MLLEEVALGGPSFPCLLASLIVRKRGRICSRMQIPSRVNSWKSSSMLQRDQTTLLSAES